MSILAYDTGVQDGYKEGYIAATLEVRNKLWQDLKDAASTGDNLELTWAEAERIFTLSWDYVQITFQK